MGLFGAIFAVLMLPFKFWGALTGLASLVVGILYPTLESFKAIESKELADDTQWLSYWVVVCSLMTVEKVAWPVLMWIPLYSLFRIAALAWLALPQFQGAKLAYQAIRPFLFVAMEKSREIPALEPYLRSYQKAFSGKVSGAPAPAASSAGVPAAPVTAASTRETAPIAVATPDLDQLKKEAINKVAESFDKAKQQQEESYQPLKAHAT
eukprot:scaffold17.g597.t1